MRFYFPKQNFVINRIERLRKVIEDSIGICKLLLRDFRKLSAIFAMICAVPLGIMQQQQILELKC